MFALLRDTVVMVTILAILWFCGMSSVSAQLFEGPCDKPKNADLPFCDSDLPFETRVLDLLSRLTLDEKIGLLTHNSSLVSGAVDLDRLWWWNEALHGVAGMAGRQGEEGSFRPPTEYATVFPQIINLASSFNRQLFFAMGNATGNEARAFANVGNSGFTFWSPDINIYRDPRWGRGHETPGEDPYLSGEYARLFVRGMEGDEEGVGFLKTSACCKHFAGYSLEADRFSFDANFTEQDMADTYLPAFKTCLQEGRVSCLMCSYNGINGIPACAHRPLLTGLVRDQWGFDGYIVSDCDAAAWVWQEQHYTDTPEEACAAVLDAGMDLECFYFIDMMGTYLRGAVDSGVATETMVDTALKRAYQVMMRLGYFEKESTRPYKELGPAVVDSVEHQELALEAARQSIVLLKNAPNVKTGRRALPLNAAEIRKARATLALIGPHVDGQSVFLGNYNGRPSFIKAPVDEIRKHVPDVEAERGCNVTSLDDARLQEAVDMAAASAQVVLFLGLNSAEVENEGRDRVDLNLPGLQNELIERVLAVAREPVILFVVSGGAVDLAELEADPRVGAIIWAGYLGQAAGEAMADVMFGFYNPSGRLAQTFYRNEFVGQVGMRDMNMRPGPVLPIGGSPGRTYRFYTGDPVYPFGYGLSYTSFAYTLDNLTLATMSTTDADECTLLIILSVRNTGQMSGDHSVLWFVAPPSAGRMGRPIKSLIDFNRINNLAPLQTAQVQLCLNRPDFQLANEEGQFEVVTGQWELMVGELKRTILIT